MKNRPLIASYYFPNWHVDERNEELHGKGWTEWPVVRCAVPRFAGHIQPKKPLWGYEDESDPAAMARKIAAAADHGIDAFLFDWYFFQSGPYRERALNEGFLKAPNRDRLKFAIMWANHDPECSHPRAWKKPADHTPWTGKLTPETFRIGTDRCIRQYMGQPNYLRVDDGVYFELYRPQPFVEDVGGMEIASELIRDFRDRVEKAGLGKLTLCGNTTGLPPYHDVGMDKVNQFCRQLGLDQVSRYGGMPWKCGFPAVDYYHWQSELYYPAADTYCDGLELPFNPNAQTGWDSSPRTVPSDMYEEAAGYPFSAVAVNDTPEQFEKVLRFYKARFQSGQCKGRILNLSCWNEWTEGAYLEPDETFGYGKLEAVRRVFGLRDEK